MMNPDGFWLIMKATYFIHFILILYGHMVNFLYAKLKILLFQFTFLIAYKTFFFKDTVGIVRKSL